MKKSLLQRIWGISLFTLLLFSQAVAQTIADFGQIAGRVVDAITEQPIVSVEIEVRARIMDKLPDGTLSLRSMDETIPIGTIHTDAMGGFTTRVALGRAPNYFKLTARADGYLEMSNVLVKVETHQSGSIDFQLIKMDLNQQEHEILDQKHEMEKSNFFQKYPSISQRLDAAPTQPSPLDRKKSLSAIQSTYPVPDQVYVKDLPESGFTGYMNFDEFISGVISKEMGDSFPFEALKAQAVAARSYALERFNRTDTASGGQAYTPMLGNKCINATGNTSKIVMLYGGSVIAAFYSARCNGDFTLNSENGLSNITTCEVGGLEAGYLAYARSQPCSGHINCSSTNETCCQVFVEGRMQHIYGHGVGMCQRGAQEFAGRDGKDWQQILNAYYTNISFANLPAITINSQIITTASINVRNTACGTVNNTIPNGTKGTIVGGPQRPFCTLDPSVSYLTWWEVLYSNGTKGWSIEDYLLKQSQLVEITIASNPSGRLFSIEDGSTYSSPHTFSWETGLSHTVVWGTPQSGGSGIQYNFSAWTDGSTANPRSITAPTSDATYTADFTTQYFLTMNANSGGSVAPSSSWHNLGQNISITATPASGYVFSSWTGNGPGSYIGSNNPASITMSGPITQTASFVPIASRTLTVASSNPNSGVNITVTPNDNNGQGNGTTQFTRIYEQGKPVTLTAPAQVGGNNFQKWLRNGADWTTGQAATVIMDDNHTMTAVYAAAPPQPTHTLTVTSSNPNSGVIVTVTPNDTNGQGNGTTQFTRTYNYDTQVRLEVPFTATGGKFQQWLRDGEFWSNSQITFVTMNDDYTITAVYSPSPGAFTEVPNAFQNTGCGRISWGDYDNDQDLDVLLTGSDSSNIYQNDNGKFSLAPISLIGVSGSSSASHAWGDYDNDGDLDILLTGRSNSGLISKLYRNDAKGFEEVSISLEGVGYGSVAWGDYDNDGDLDILLTGQSFAVAPYINIARIYRNDGNDVFRSIAAPLEGVSNSSVAWGDYDNDGDLDIALAGSGMSFSTVSRIYKNENGNFEDILAPLTPVTAGSVAWGDNDNDGDLDLLLTGHEIPGPIIELYENDNGKFEKVTASMTGVYNSSAAWGDYDNDGDLDVLLSGTDSSSVHISRVYQNDGENFSEVPLSLPGLYFSSAAWGDYDNDGDLDFLLSGRTASDDRVTKLYLNNVTKPNTVSAVPTGLNASVSGNAATFNWNKSTDNQTAQNALTYNLRIGKTPGGTQIVSPMASTATGYRKVPQLGNTNHRNSWTIKNLSPGTYYWSVQAIDNAFAGSAFAPEQNFIIAPAQTIEVTAPLAGATWTAGSTQSVNWISSGVTGNVNIKLSTDDGRTFPIPLAANIENDGSDSIKVPSNPSTTCRIRVESVSDTSVHGLNPGNFSIVPKPVITVTAPPAGAMWIVGSSQSVNWTSSGVTGNVNIKLSTDGGITFPITLASNIVNDGLDSIKVPNNPSKTCRIRVESVSDSSVFGLNPGNFTIAPAQTIEVTAPPAGATWTAGSTQSVNWNSSGVAGKVDIKLSTDGGTTFPITLAENIVNDGSQLIPVPDIDVPLTTCRIKVESVADSSIYGLNPGNFSIVPKPSITVTAPAAGATWIVGSSQSVNWTSGGVTGKVNIKLSTDGGKTFPDTLAKNIVNDGSQLVPVPPTASSTCRIRVELVSDTSVFGINPGNFTIDHKPAIKITAPSGGETWPIGTAQTVSWTSNGIIDTVNIRLSTDSGISFQIPLATKIANHDSATITVPNNLSGSCRIRVESDSDLSVFGDSPVNFAIVTSVSEREATLPQAHHLKQNYPNPFNPGTAISFTLPKAGEVTLTIYSSAGQLIKQVARGRLAAGQHQVNWDGRNAAGEQVAAGIYLYRLIVRDAAGAVTFTETKRMALLK